MRSPKLLSHMSNIYGEPVVPYLYFTGTGQVNYGPPGTGLKVDQWHFDSVHYVAVVICR